MEEAIEKLVRRCFSEISSGYHLPRLARVVAICDPMNEPQVCDTFRPYYAADLELLTPDMLPDTSAPIYRQVPLPVPLGGTEEQGLTAYPNEGTIVEIAFAYGLPHRPFIRTILPHLSGLAELKPNEQAWQQSEAVRQRAAENGDWLRETFANIIDKSSTRIIEAASNEERYCHESKQVSGNSEETIDGFKRLVALSALRLLTGGTAHIGSGDNFSLSSATDLQTFIGHDLKQSIGNDHVQQVSHDSIETIGNIKQSLAQLKQLVKVADGGKVWLGSESVNVLQILSNLIQLVSDLASTCASHNHGTTPPPNQAAAFTAHGTEATSLKSTLDPVIE